MVILMCGKICSGKTAYAEELRRETGAVILSVDEIMLAVFGQDAGEKHDEYAAGLKKYLYEKSAELAATGVDVIMDAGLWTKAERRAAREFYASRGIPAEIRFLDVSDAEWSRRVEKRNREVAEGKTSAYYVDEGLAAKLDRLFERPEPGEVDMRISD